MTRTCPTCHTPYRAEDVSFELRLAKCRTCDALEELPEPARPTRSPFESKEDVPVGRSPFDAAEPPMRARVAHPSGVQRSERGADLVLTWRWFSMMALFLTFFALFWDGFLVVWYTLALSDFMANGNDIMLVPLLFPLLHVAVGVGISYYAMTLWVNRTTITCGPKEVRVVHGPLPWRTPAAIPRADLEQLYVVRQISRGKNGTTTTYDLMAVRRQGDAVKVVTGLDEIEKARFLEQEMERHLGIVNRPVHDEA